MGIWNEQLRKFAVAAGIAGVGITGCDSSDAPKPGEKNGAATTDVKSAQLDSYANDPMSPAAGKSAAVNFDQSFADAASTEVLGAVPPDVTIAGKRTGRLREGVEELWPKIKLTDANGKPMARTLLIETSEGTIEISLRPEIAPNHVRNILALAKLGFYDGLFFERNVHQEADIDGEKSRFDLLIAGCPLGTGDDGYGHLGYSILAEFQPDLKHGEGTVGFWHEEDPDSAGTRFYITLGPAPALDGKFTIIGQVRKGLDVVKRIASQPVKSNDPSSPDNEKPVHPTSIKKIAIHPDVMEK